MPRLALVETADNARTQDRAAAVAALAARFAATADEVDLSAAFPHANLAALHAAGLLGLVVPAAHGGAGEGMEAAADVVRALGGAEPATALVLAMHYIQHGTLARTQTWPEAARALVSRTAVRDGALINALRVEPELGSPGRGGLPATTARRDGAGWRLSGRKIFSTGIPALRWLVVWARTDEPEPRVGQFLVDARATGIGVIETWDHLGLRASASHDVELSDAPAVDAVDIRPPAAWAAADTTQWIWNAVLLGSLYTGIAETARNWLVRYLHGRAPSNLGAPLATLPRMQAEVGEIESLIRVSRRLIAGIARDYDRGDPNIPDLAEAQIVKRRATADAIAAVERAVALVGNAGLMRRNPLERHLRDVLCGRIHAPQDDMVAMTAGKAALDEGAVS